MEAGVGRPHCERNGLTPPARTSTLHAAGRQTAEKKMSQHTADHHQVTTAATEMILLSEATLPAVDAELRYSCDDPFAVQMLLSVDQSPAISWVFGRELLMTGVSMPAGIGDVQVYPTHDGVIIELRSGGAVATLLGHIPDFREFTNATAELVPLGSEMDHYSLDPDLSSI